ncbi:hypothetical protein ACYOEI_03795 [Singulisphaera rosea]
MDVVLKGGPLDAQTVTIAVARTTYSTRIDDRLVVYIQSNERTERGQQVFLHRPAQAATNNGNP